MKASKHIAILPGISLIYIVLVTYQSGFEKNQLNANENTGHAIFSTDSTLDNTLSLTDTMASPESCSGFKCINCLMLNDRLPMMLLIFNSNCKSQQNLRQINDILITKSDFLIFR